LECGGLPPQCGAKVPHSTQSLFSEWLLQERKPNHRVGFNRISGEIAKRFQTPAKGTNDAGKEENPHRGRGGRGRIGGVIQERHRLLVQTPEMMKKRFRINVRTRTEVVAVDRDRKEVRARNLVTGEGGESISSTPA